MQRKNIYCLEVWNDNKELILRTLWKSKQKAEKEARLWLESDFVTRAEVRKLEGLEKIAADAWLDK